MTLRKTEIGRERGILDLEINHRKVIEAHSFKAFKASTNQYNCRAQVSDHTWIMELIKYPNGITYIVYAFFFLNVLQCEKVQCYGLNILIHITSLEPMQYNP